MAMSNNHLVCTADLPLEALCKSDNNMFDVNGEIIDLPGVYIYITRYLQVTHVNLVYFTSNFLTFM